jgi:hypothetical protein
MTTPSIPDFIAGYGPQQSDWQSLWVNPLTFFQNRVVFRALQATTATTLPSSGALTKIAFDDILEDPYSGWSSSTHEWTAPVTGLYHVTFCVFMTSGATNDEWSVLPQIVTPAVINYGEPLAAVALGTGASAAECTTYVYLQAGEDFVCGQAALLDASASLATNLTTGAQSSFEVMWIAG